MVSAAQQAELKVGLEQSLAGAASICSDPVSKKQGVRLQKRPGIIPEQKKLHNDRIYRIFTRRIFFLVIRYIYVIFSRQHELRFDAVQSENVVHSDPVDSIIVGPIRKQKMELKTPDGQRQTEKLINLPLQQFADLLI